MSRGSGGIRAALKRSAPVLAAIVVIASACHVHVHKRAHLHARFSARAHLDCMLDESDALDDGWRAPDAIAAAADAVCVRLFDQAKGAVDSALRERLRNEHLEAAKARVAERRGRPWP